MNLGGWNKLVLGHEMADRNFLLEDTKSAKFSLFSVIGSIGLVKAIRLGKWRESAWSQLTCTPINGRHALYNLIRSIRGHRFLMLTRPWLRGPICSLIFVQLTWRQTRAPMSSSLHLSLQFFLMRSVWETRLCWSCKSCNCQRKLNEGLN